MEAKRISPVVWEIPRDYKKEMLVPARIYATEKIFKEMDSGVYEQITNVASLPGIKRYAFCMPDAHQGYGFPIGGVAAFDPKEKGVISPGGVGFDINCGELSIVTNLNLKEIKPKIKELVNLLFQRVPAGVGAKGFVKLNKNQFDEVLTYGAKWAVENGYGWPEDLERMEDNGCIKWANPHKVSSTAVQRGINQLGTLGSGNHYLEIQLVKKENIFDPIIAEKLGFFEDGQIALMVHCGSRGFGHQIGTDYLKKFLQVMPDYGIKIVDRELASAPLESQEGEDYFQAMACAANMAFANRLVIVHRVRECFSQVFGKTAEELEMHLVYDVAHNIAKKEKHLVEGKIRELIVHRKGATRAFGPSREELPRTYRSLGQPVIIGGSMETGSFICLGLDQSEETFCSTMHGSGRTMSRIKAKKMVRGSELQRKMEEKGILVKAVSMAGLAEEAGFAYKDINEVVETMHLAGITKKILALKPLGNIKG